MVIGIFSVFLLMTKHLPVRPVFPTWKIKDNFKRFEGHFSYLPYNGQD